MLSFEKWTTRLSHQGTREVLAVAVADRRLAVNPAAGVAQPRLPLAEQRFLEAGELTAAYRRDAI